MKRLATAITIVCFLTVSIMGNSILFLCALMGCEVVVVAAAPAPKSMPDKCSPCRDWESSCAGSACEPIEPEEQPVNKSCQSLWMLTHACYCVRTDPSLTAVLGDYRYKGPPIPATDLLSPGDLFVKTSAHSIPEFARSQGVHSIIATTVLRL
ncbi:MAG: hypothetical protein GY839_06790 [candidate division Zixibacteria bacterium]|nr:hypothetical protein [candidate division Zixibacteria bacterium]